MTWQRVHGFTSLSTTPSDCERVDVVLVVRLEPGEHDVRPEAVHRQRRPRRREPRVEVGERRLADRRATDSRRRTPCARPSRRRNRDCSSRSCAGSKRTRRTSRAERRRQPRGGGVARVVGATALSRRRPRAWRRRVARADTSSAAATGASRARSAPSAHASSDQARAAGCSRCVTKRPSRSTIIHSRSPTAPTASGDEAARGHADVGEPMPRQLLTG